MQGPAVGGPLSIDGGKPERPPAGGWRRNHAKTGATIYVDSQKCSRNFARVARVLLPAYARLLAEKVRRSHTFFGTSSRRRHHRQLHYTKC